MAVCTVSVCELRTDFVPGWISGTARPLQWQEGK